MGRGRAVPRRAGAAHRFRCPGNLISQESPAGLQPACVRRDRLARSGARFKYSGPSTAQRSGLARRARPTPAVESLCPDHLAAAGAVPVRRRGRPVRGVGEEALHAHPVGVGHLVVDQPAFGIAARVEPVRPGQVRRVGSQLMNSCSVSYTPPSMMKDIERES